MRNLPLTIGLCMLAILLAFMFLAPFMPFIDMDLQPEKYRVDEERNITLAPFKPSAQNLIGTDKEGIDNLSKLVVGAKETVFLILAIAMLRYIIAIPLGLLAYKGRGPAHWIVTGWNQMFSSIPTIFSAALLVSMPFLLVNDLRMVWVIVILASIEVGRVAYLVQQHTNKIANEPFIESGIALGNNSFGLYRRYYLPSLFPELIVNFCLDVGKVMLLLGQLGVLGIFISQTWVQLNYGLATFLDDSYNWGTLIAKHRRDIMFQNYSFIFYPALCIMFTILTFNLIGEGLRKHFNRKTNAE